MRRAIHTDTLQHSSLSNVTFDVISMFNVLDRCSKPLTLLEDIYTKLHSHKGLLILSVVFPFSPYVETTKDHLPIEWLDIGGTFENSCNDLLKILVRIGFTIKTFSKVPYISIEDGIYVLNNAVFVLVA